MKELKGRGGKRMIDGIFFFITTLFSTPLLAYITIGFMVVGFHIWIDKFSIPEIPLSSLIFGIVFWPMLVLNLIIDFFEVRQMRKEI